MKASSFLIATGLATMMVLGAFAPVGVAPSENSNGIGKHVFKFNLIARPNTYEGSGDDSNGHRVFISLDPAKKNDETVDAPTCENGNKYTDESDVIADGAEGSGEPVDFTLDHREKLYFEKGDTWEVLDGDATKDNVAVVQLGDDIYPTDEDGLVTGPAQIQVWLRTVGKPGGCLNGDGFTTATDQNGDQYWYAGSFEVERNKGKPTKLEITEMFEVYACFDNTDDGVENYVDDCGTYSVFADVFDGFFVALTNDGLRTVQVIFTEA